MKKDVVRRVVPAAKWGWIVAALMAWMGSGSAARAQAREETLSPDWVVHRALDANPTLEAASSRVLSARSRVAQVGDLDDPMLMLRVWGLPIDVVSRPPDQIMLMAQQSFPLSGVRGDRERVEATRARDAETERVVARHAVVQEAELAFVRVWEAHRSVAALIEQLATAEQLHTIAVARSGAATASPVDVAATAVEIARVQTDLETARLRSDGSRAGLRVVLGLSPDAPLGDPVDIGVADELPSLDALVREALRTRPELELPESALARSRAMGDTARAQNAPVMTVGGGLMSMPNAMQLGDAFGWMVELGVSVPIWRDARNAREDEATALAGEARAARDAWRRALTQEVTAAWEEATVTRGRLAALESGVASAVQASWDTALAQYGASGGLASAVDALRLFVALDVELVAARADAIRAEVMLSHAAGRLPHHFTMGGAR